MYTDEEIRILLEEEKDNTEETVLLILLALGLTKDDIKREISNFFTKYGKDGVVTITEARKWVSSKNHNRRLFLLNEFIESAFDDVLSNIEGDLKRHLVRSISNSAKQWGVTLNSETIDAILNKSWGIEDLNWKSRFDIYRTKWSKILSNDLATSFIKQDSITSVLNSTGKRFESMDKVMRRFVRTQTTVVRSYTDKACFEELGVKYCKFHTQGDNLVCETCDGMNGNIIPVASIVPFATAPPIHWNCRCFLEPIYE